MESVKAVGELVELLRQMGQLVLPRRLEPVAVLPLAHDADGPQQGPDAGGEHFGEEETDQQGNDHQHQRDGAQVLLQAHEQRPLGVVPVADIDAADGHAPVQNGGGGSGEKHPVLIVGVEHVVPLEGQGHLLKQGVLIGRLGGGGASAGVRRRLGGGRIPLALLALGEAVVQDQPRGVGDQNALQSHVVQHVHHPGHLVGREGLQLHEGGGHDRDLTAQGVLLGGDQQILGGDQGVGVQQNQHHRQQGQVAQGVLDLEAGEKGDLLFFLGFGRRFRHGVSHPLLEQVVTGRKSRRSSPDCSGSSPPPTWCGCIPDWPGPAPAFPAGGGCARPPYGSPRYTHSPIPH